MGYSKKNLSRKGMLHRSRIDALIDGGLRHYLLVVLAGPGYGKTQALVDYLNEKRKAYFWIRLTAMDNFPTHFWGHLIRTLKTVRSELAAKIERLGFPDNYSSLAEFVRILENEEWDKKEVLWIFDDFGEIEDLKIRNFFEALTTVDSEYLHIVLLSNDLENTESMAFIADREALILAKDLRFTQSEILDLYKLHGLSLNGEELRQVEEYTEGWPLTLYLLAVQNGGKINEILPKGIITHDTISWIFEKRFFFDYTGEYQKLLVQLSLLNSFTISLAAELYGHENFSPKVLSTHAFVKKELSINRLFFHHLYQIFLSEKKYMLTKEEQRNLWRKAAKYYIESGESMEAITCYRNSGDYKSMLDVIIDAITSKFTFNPRNAACFLEHLDLMASEEIEGSLTAGVIRVWIYINISELEKADKLIEDLEKKLLADDSSDRKSLLGEIYLEKGLIQMTKGEEDFGFYYKKAFGCNPQGSRLSRQSKMKVFNHNSFFIKDNSAGALERMKKAIHYGVPWMAKVMHGSMSGMQSVFSAEAAFLTYHLEDAQKYAYRAIYEAEEFEQHDLICNSYCILMRIGLMLGDFAEMERNIQHIVSYTEKYDIDVLADIRDTALAWYYIKLRDFDNVPKGFAETENTGNIVLTSFRRFAVYANYLANTEEYSKLAGMLEYFRNVALSDAVTQEGIYLHLMLAIANYHLNKPDAVVKSLYQAYDMSYANGLVTPFIEADYHMTGMLDLIKGQQAFEFDPKWIETIESHTAEFCRRSSRVRTIYRRQNMDGNAKDNPLSRRERMVLQDLAQGLTREEVANKQYISVNTVKSTLRTIYNKLDANNRTDAVSIAMTNGFIDGYKRRWD